MTHIIVVGNEKGGAGKSTVSMHIATALARMGHPTGVIDLDLRQRSFERYVENRVAFLKKSGFQLPSPEICKVPDAAPSGGASPEADRLNAAIEATQGRYDFILIDCPGAHTPFAEAAHMLADTLVTPLNDSFVDFDLLARVDESGSKIKGPSIYSEMVWKARQLRAQTSRNAIDWIVVPNRLGTQRMVNKDKMLAALSEFSKRIGFRVTIGFSERVVFRELFPQGLTLLDLKDTGIRQLNISNIAARQELRDLIKSLKLPGVKVNF